RRGVLHLARVKGRGGAVPVPARDPVQARGPARQGGGAEGMSRAAKIALLVVVLAALVVLAKYFMKGSDVCLMTLCCVYLMATFGLNLTVGYAGQMSLGQAAFFGIGAYHAAILLKFGWPFFAVLPIAALACFVLGLALGFPALRVQHHYLAFAT